VTFAVVSCMANRLSTNRGGRASRRLRGLAAVYYGRPICGRLQGEGKRKRRCRNIIFLRTSLNLWTTPRPITKRSS